MSDSSRWAGEKRIQTSEESLHWISYNLKNMVAELKRSNGLLESIRCELATKNDIAPERLPDGETPF